MRLVPDLDRANPAGIAVLRSFPFGLLTMCVSLEAIFLSVIVLLSRDRQAAGSHPLTSRI
jgi:hypothetical protein